MYQTGLHARRWAEWFPRDWSLITLPKTFSQGGRGAFLVPATDFALYWRVGTSERHPRDWQEGMCRNWFICDTQPQHRDQASRGHPCPRPPDGVKYIVRSLAPPGGLVLDPFGGSGTTAVAAIHEGRRCLIIEKEPAYCDIIRRRVAEAMGEGKGSLFGPSQSHLC